jgi:hypothetical protein
MYLPSGNTLGFSTNGTERIRICCSGDVRFTGINGGRIITLNAPTNGGSLTFESSGTAYADVGSYPSTFGGGSATDFVLNTRSGYSLTIGTSNTPRLTIASTGAATFSSTVSLGGDLIFTIASRSIVFNSTNTLLWENSGSLNLRTCGIDRLTISCTGAATFSSSVSLKGCLTIVRSNTTESSIINNEGNLNYNARDNFNHVFQSNGTEIARISTTGAATFSGLGTFTNATSNNQLTVNGTGAIKSGINFANGGTTYGQIYFDNNAPYNMSVLQQYTTGNLILGTNNTANLTIGNNGNVGIGTCCPSQKLNVKGGLFPLKIEPTTSSTDGVSLTMGYNGLIYCSTAPSYKTFTIQNALNDAIADTYLLGGGGTGITIKNTGNVGINTTSPTALLSIQRGASGDNMEFIGSGDSGYSDILFYNTSKAARLGYIDWSNTQVRFNVEANIPLAFHTNSSPRLTIASTGAATFSSSVTTNGDITIAKSIPVLYFNSTSFCNGVLYNPGTSLRFTNSNGTTPPFIYDILTGAVTISNLANGAVTSNNGTLSASSDMNLKISDGYIDKALDKIMNLKPRYFYWKEESGLPTDIRQLGFYAQEVNQSLGEESANTPKNENEKWGIFDRSIIAFLTKAIQEQQCTICLQSLMMNNLKICLGIK